MDVNKPKSKDIPNIKKKANTKGQFKVNMLMIFHYLVIGVSNHAFFSSLVLNRSFE